MDSAWTHVAAIVVGILVAMLFMSKSSSSSSQKSQQQQADRSIAVPSSDTASKKKKKKNKKKKDADAQVESKSVVVVEKETTTAAKSSDNGVAASKKSKTKKKAKSTAPPKKATPATTNGKSATTTSANNNNNNDDSDEDSDDEVVKPKTEAVVPTKPKATPKPVVVQQQEDAEEWSTIGQSKKKTRAKKPVAAATAKPTATSAATTESVQIDGKKVGIIIGPKGATMQAIQDATGCKLEVNAPPKEDNNNPKANKQTKATIVITGNDKQSMNKAKKAIQELAAKGIATLLQTDKTFGEHYITVHPRHLSEIVGPNGRNIQALQTALSIKITIPQTDWKPNQPELGNRPPTCKVGIAGPREACLTAKKTLQQLVDYHYTAVTHPGCTHEEIYVPQEFFHCVIGPRGSQIKHIRGNYKVDVYMPTAGSITENAIVVGKQSQVDKAISYIQVLMERDAKQRERKYNDEYY